MVEITSELEYFSNLSSDVKSIRIASVRGILKRIKHNSSEIHVVYLMCKRLFRGLGGKNPALRQGCFSSVVGLLKLLPDDFELNVLEDIINSELKPAGSNSKLEEGEAYLGQSLAYGAMIVSNFICKKSEDEHAAVFEKLFEISKKRSYLHHVSFSFLSMLVMKLGREFHPDGFLIHLQDLSTNTLDKLNYLLALVDIPVKTNTIKNVLGTKRFFDMNNVNRLSVLLKKNKSLIVLEHDFFSIFTEKVLKHPEFLRHFWDSFCDNKFSKTEGGDKPENSKQSADLFVLHLGQILFKQCTRNENGLLAEYIFCEKFINIILRSAKSHKRLIQSVLQEFCGSLKYADDGAKLRVIKQIIFENGLLNFDFTTGSKTILTITNSLSFKSISELANDYKSVLEGQKDIPKKDIESKIKGLIICLNFYTKIMNNPTCCDEINWRLSQLIYLLKMGFFKQPNIHFNREVSQCLQEAFISSLGHRFPNLESFKLVIQGIVSEMHKMLQEPDLTLINKFTDEMKTAWTCAINVAKKMDKLIDKNPSHKDILFVLKVILQYMAILLLKEPSTAVTNIHDLKNIYEDLTEKKSVDETMWIVVLIDLFLNLLSKPNYHHRHIIKCTFKFICPHLTQDAFLQIVDVLDLNYESENVNNEGQEESESEEDIEVDGNEKDSSEGEKDSENDIEDDSSEESMEEDLSTNEKLRLELRNALGAVSDTESVDLDEMEEEEGKKLDERLSSIFRANLKKKRKDNLSKYQNQLAHFRTRVMDLIEICTEVVMPLSFWLKALVPLVDLLGSTIGQSKLDCLRSRIRVCFKKLNSTKITSDEINATDLVPLLESLMEKASKSGIFADMKNDLICLLKFLLKASKPFKKGLKPKSLEKNEIFQCVKNNLKNVFIEKNNAPLQLYTGLAAIGWDGIFPLISELLQYLFKTDIKYHKKLWILQILEIFIKTPQFFDGHYSDYYAYYVPEIKGLLEKYTEAEIVRIGEDKQINNKYHSELWNVLNVVINRQNKSQIPIMIDAENTKDWLENNIINFPSMKGVCKKNFRKLCSTLLVNVSKPTKVDSIQNNKSSFTKSSGLKRKGTTEVVSKKKKKIKTTKLTSV